MEDCVPFGGMKVLGPLLCLCLHSIRLFHFDMSAVLQGLGERIQLLVNVSGLLWS